MKAFFVVSGFPYLHEFERSSRSGLTLKRVRRIYPAYFTVVTLCAIGLVAVSSLTVADYFSSAWAQVCRRQPAFLNFLHPRCPAFSRPTRYPKSICALWTLKIEVMFYLSVPCLFFSSTLLAFLGDSRHLLRASVAYFC